MTQEAGADPISPSESPAAAPGPSWSQRRGRAVLWARRQRIGLFVLVASVTVAVVIGIALGRATATGPELEARRAVETQLLPLAVDADGIWTSSSDDRDPVSQALVALRNDNDPTLVLRNHQRWLDAYDGLILRIAGTDVPPTARPIQRHMIAAVTLSRDAVEVLATAAATEDEVARARLAMEAARLRQRSEQMIQSARAAAVDLGGQRVDVSPLPDLTGFES